MNVVMDCALIASLSPRPARSVAGFAVHSGSSSRDKVRDRCASPSRGCRTALGEDERPAVEVPDLPLADDEPLTDEAGGDEALVSRRRRDHAEAGPDAATVAVERGDRTAGVDDDAAHGKRPEGEPARRRKMHLGIVRKAP